MEGYGVLRSKVEVGQVKSSCNEKRKKEKSVLELGWVESSWI